MSKQTVQNRARNHDEVFVVEPVASREEDHHFGIEKIWDLVSGEGKRIRRGLVKWFDSAGGGFGFWKGSPHHRVEIEASEVLWLEVDGGIRRWLEHNDFPPCLYDIVERIARDALGIETLEERGRDDLDFHEVSVVGLRRAIERAYIEGVKR